MGRRLFVLQGGGPTAVINATLASVVEAASGEFEQVFGLIHGFEGRSGQDVVDLAEFRDGGRNRALALTPGSILGSSRRKVTEKDLSRVLARMEEYKADSVIGIGGNGTMTALGMLDEHARNTGRDVHICGAPKTVDNDLPGLHVCPGYGSAARFVALATRDFGFDSRAMSTFDDVTILETMGRDTGWIAAASTLLKESEDDPPSHCIDTGTSRGRGGIAGECRG
jgi:ATP-dependent phosphofructokinase / diphosphate-dependent phosphofructokinase